LDVNGSPEYVLTWKEWAMQSGPPICALRARARPTSGNACGGSQIEMSGWPTPQQHDTTGAKTPEQIDAIRSRCRAEGKGSPGFGNLNEAAQLAGWATPAAREAGGTPEQFLARKEKAVANGSSLGVSLTSLALQAQLTGWATPTTRDHKDGSTDLAKAGVPINGLLGRQVSMASGPTAPSSPAPTERRAALNPYFSLWLMDYPKAWLTCLPKPASRSRKASPGV